MKTANEFFELIREKGLWTLSMSDARELFALDQPSYDAVVTLLMTDNGNYERSLHDYQYSDVWMCQMAGCHLFTLRPNLAVYETVLRGTLKIADPSSCRDPVDALLQVKSKGDVVLDFLKLIQLNKTDPDTDETNSRIFNMFYAMKYDRSWPEYHVYALSQKYGEFLQQSNEMGHPSTPATAPDEALRISMLILETMLDLFEANNSNQTARVIIAWLTLSDKDHQGSYRERVIRAFTSASQSTDEYVRHRVSHPHSLMNIKRNI